MHCCGSAAARGCGPSPPVQPLALSPAGAQQQQQQHVHTRAACGSARSLARSLVGVRAPGRAAAGWPSALRPQARSRERAAAPIPPPDASPAGSRRRGPEGCRVRKRSP